MKKIIVLCALLLMNSGCLASGGSFLGNAAMNAVINVTAEYSTYAAFDGLRKVFGGTDGEKEQWNINNQYSNSGVSVRNFPLEEYFSAEEFEDENSD